MTQGKKIPRIESISKVDGFRVYCVFSTGEHRVIDFEKLFAEWGVKPDDMEYMLLNLEEFKKIKLRDGILSWDNVEILLVKEDGTEGKFPYDIDPIVLYNHTELVTSEEDEISLLDIKDNILIKIAQLKDKKLLKRLLIFLANELHEEVNIEEDWWENLPPIQQERLLRLQEEARAGKNLISNEDAWKRLKTLAPQ